MQKQKNYQLAVIAILAFAVLFMSVGFAAYAQRLSINGTTTVAGAKWSVHFDENSFQVADDSVVPNDGDVTIGDTSIEYTVTLEKPGDKFVFSIDAINDGSFDAVLNKISLTPLSADQQKYLSYTLTYDGVTYSSTTSNLNDALLTTAGMNRKNVSVEVMYKLPSNAEDLPEDEVEVSLAAYLDYAQATN